MSPIVYRIDRDDRIVGVNEQWEDFARTDGQGSQVAGAQVLGSELWSAVADATVQQLYRLIVAKARGGAVVRFLYRCDAPGLRRVFEMRVELIGSDVVFTSTLQSAEARKPVAFLEANRARGADLIRMCSWCQKVSNAQGAWLGVEEAVVSMRLLAKVPMPRITHGICEPCLAGMLEVVGRNGV
ncbi:MAG TPA: hypothetical protein VL069_15280 [Opitutus sp.]|nr:hypothetical protein [Opitutus sp.]